MKTPVKNLQNKTVGEIELPDAVFGVAAREDILARVIQWQRDKRRAGTHATKGISQIRGTTAKPWAQKGTGRARQGSLRSPQFRKGAVIFGPLPRSHENKMPKKIRQQALRVALSVKQAEGKLIVLDEARASSAKTKPMVEALKKLGVTSALIIDGAHLDNNFTLSVRNIANIDVLPEGGANVYDILQHDTLVLTKNAVEQLGARLK